MSPEYRLSELQRAKKEFIRTKEALAAETRRMKRTELNEDLLFWGNKIAYLEAADREVSA